MTRQSITPIAPAFSTFNVRKLDVSRILQSIAGNPGRYPGDPSAHSGLMGRTDLSGKQARQLSQNRRALEKAQQEIEAEHRALIEQHTKLFPEGHEKAGEKMPVADENIANMQAFTLDRREMFEEPIAITCPGLTAEWLDGMAADGRTPLAAILDPLYDLEIGGATDNAAFKPGLVAEA